ncbi:MAG: VOC family protein [Woeseiaceae bacterium]|nr:VOC family protein [Woeseiaceae bacterium]
MQTANPINISRIDHVVLRARDPAAMLAFYVNVLGCRLERSLDEVGLLQLRAGQSLIDLVDMGRELGKAGGKPPDQGAPNMDHVCLLVKPWNEAAILAHLEAHGVVAGEVASRYGATGQGPSIYLKDPEGNTVELKGTP